MPKPIPKHLLTGLAAVDQSEIECWWRALSEEMQSQITAVCGSKKEDCFFGIVGSEQFPEIEGGHFLPGAEDPIEDGAWQQDRFEHLMNHPELVVVWDPETRKLHIGCVAHTDAKKCWANGHVPEDFECPFGLQECLMVPLLGRTVGIHGAASKGRKPIP